MPAPQRADVLALLNAILMLDRGCGLTASPLNVALMKDSSTDDYTNKAWTTKPGVMSNVQNSFRGCGKNIKIKIALLV